MPKLTVDAAPLSFSNIPDATQNSAYSYQLVVLNAPAGYVYTFAVTSGNLPNGISLSASGVLSGVATQAGDFTFTVTITDQNGTATVIA
jgi:hypothetical protein